MEQNKIIIAVDGVSSSGKSTIARQLAKDLNYIYIDTGAMYRAVTLFAIENGFYENDVLQTEKLLESLSDIKIDFDKDGKTLLNSQNVEDKIRGMLVSSKVSEVSAVKGVRDFLVEAQRKIGEKKGVVMDGRDIGTVVFPSAEVKLFIDSSAKVRAKRRYDELIKKGVEVDFEQVLENIEHRDNLDSTRDISPLKKADDAISIDNSDMSPEEQMEIIKKIVKNVYNKIF